MKPTALTRLRHHALSVGKETWQTAWELIKITVPAVIITKILEQIGLVDYISGLLAPVMGFVGLPGSLGLVWATAMMTSIYGGIGVLAVLAPGMTLSGAQLTVLGSMMLIAHALPIELSVSTRAGARFWPIALVRIVGALIYGFLLHHCCRLMQLWQEPAEMLFHSAVGNHPTLPVWALQQLRNLALILVVIFCIVIAMRLLKAVGFLQLLERLLSPVLPWFGMSRNAAPLTVVGMLMGIGYGGALIIREACSGKLSREEIFYSMVLMGLCHSLFEDTLLIAAIGGKFLGILWGRMAFALGVVYLMVRLGKWLAAGRVETTEGNKQV